MRPLCCNSLTHSEYHLTGKTGFSGLANPGEKLLLSGMAHFLLAECGDTESVVTVANRTCVPVGNTVGGPGCQTAGEIQGEADRHSGSGEGPDKQDRERLVFHEEKLKRTSFLTF